MQRWRARIAVLVVALVSLPALALGLLYDDFFFRAGYSGLWGRRGALDMYDFVAPSGPQSAVALRDVGLIPWWTADGLRIRFLRPLGSLSQAIDIEVFGNGALGPHLHSLLWFAGLLAVVWWLGRVLVPERLQGWAWLIYSLAGAHMSPLAWPAARYALMATLGCLAAIGLHVRGRTGGSVRDRVVAVVIWCLALSCGEAAVAGGALVFSYEVFGRREALGARVRALLPWLAIGALYLGAYAAASYGTSHSALYLNPLEAPMAYAGVVVRRLPILAGDLLAGFPALVSFLVPGASVVLTAIGLLSAGGVALSLWLLRHHLSDDERGLIRWLAPGAVLAMLPACAGIPGGRSILVALWAVAVLLSILFTTAMRRRKTHRLAWVPVCAVVLGPLFVSPLMRLGQFASLKLIGEQTWALAQQFSPECRAGADGLIVVGDDPIISLYVPPAAALSGTFKLRSLQPLSMVPRDHRLTRKTARLFELEALPGPAPTNPWIGLYRSKPPPLGTTVKTRAHTARVVRTGPTGVEQVAFTLHDPENICLIEWDGTELRSIPLPAVGRSIVVRQRPGPSTP